MKHTLKITLLLLAIFLFSQLFGLTLIAKEGEVTQADGITSVSYDATAIGERPQTEGAGSLIYVLIGLGLGTGLVLLIIKYRTFNLWRAWFFLAVWLSITVTLGAIIKTSIFFSYDIAFLLAAIAAALKLKIQHPLVHNTTELLMYAGIALLLVPLFTLSWACILLVLISAYDMYAVWKSKHMVSMAKFQQESNLFAGLLVKYKPTETAQEKSSVSPGAKKESSAIRAAKISASAAKKIRVKGKDTQLPFPPLPAGMPTPPTTRTAILGGGDVAFPLIFTGATLTHLLTLGFSKPDALLLSAIITITATISLALLFFFAKKDRYYPAMPFLSAGCFVGLGIVMLLSVY